LYIRTQGQPLLHIAASCIELFWNSAQVNRLFVHGWIMSEHRAARTPEQDSKAFLIVPILVALWFLNSFAFEYLTGERDRFGIYWPRHEWLYVHIVAGMLALLVGPIQFWLGLNRREKLLHRILGGAYVLAVFSSGGAALYLARHTDFGWVFGMGMIVMSLAWMMSTSLAAISIFLHLVEQHREWMTRSYVMTFGFVTFRMCTLLWQVAGIGTTLEQMTAASWFSWSVPLLITECVIQGRKIFAARRRSLSEKKALSRKSVQIELFDSASV
jgi:Predicted membrane protein (DUF2306)